MVTNVHNSQSEQGLNTVAFNRPTKKSQTAGQASALSKDNSPQFQLSQLLQTSLDLQLVLRLFFNEATKHLKLSSLIYNNQKINTQFNFGRISKHSCHYHLTINNTDLGDVSFTRNKRFNENELAILESLISCLICPIKNALLYQEALQAALKDPLTGVGNRIALENTLDREIGLAHRHKDDFSILIIDLDLFKEVNDNYGHSAGDCVLKDTAKQLIACCRETDACYRYGGEEFVMILNKTNSHGAKMIAERIRHHIAAITTTFENIEINITASIGIATLDMKESKSDLFIRADKALYAAKDNGRNQIMEAEQYKEQ